MYKEVLLAVDGSENSRRAAEEALHLSDDKTRITLLHVMDPDDNQGDIVRSTNERAWNKKRKMKCLPSLHSSTGRMWGINI
ncbi:universal stress protein [Salinicoccus sp. CNSTN-B1]